MNNSPEYFTIPLIPWDDLKTRQRLDLPKFEFKIDKIKYKATDLRLLNPLAIQAFNIIIEYIKEYPNIEEVRFNVSDLNKDEIFVITEIITGLSFEAKKGGKNGFTIVSNLIATRFRQSEEEGKKIISFELIKDHAKALHDYLNLTESPYEHTEIIRVCFEAARDALFGGIYDNQTNID